MSTKTLIYGATLLVVIIIVVSVAVRATEAREGLTTSTCPPGMRRIKKLPDGSIGTFCEMPGTGHMAIANAVYPRGGSREGFAACGTVLPNAPGSGDDGPRFASGVECERRGPDGGPVLACAASPLECIQAGGIPR